MGDEDLNVLSAHVLAATLSEQVSLWVGIIVGFTVIAGAVASVFAARRKATDKAASEMATAFLRGADSRDADFRAQRLDFESRIRDLDARLAVVMDDRNEARRRLELLEARAFDYGKPPAERPRPGDK